MGLEETICIKGDLHLAGKIAGKPIAIPIRVDSCARPGGTACEVPLLTETMPVSIGRFTIATIEVPDKDWAIPPKDIGFGPIKIPKGSLLRIQKGDFFKKDLDAELGGDLQLEVKAWAPAGASRRRKAPR